MSKMYLYLYFQIFLFVTRSYSWTHPKNALESPRHSSSMYEDTTSEHKRHSTLSHKDSCCVLVGCTWNTAYFISQKCTDKALQLFSHDLLNQPTHPSLFVFFSLAVRCGIFTDLHLSRSSSLNCDVFIATSANEWKKTYWHETDLLVIESWWSQTRK